MQTALKPRIVRRHEGQKLNVMGSNTTVLLNAEQTGGAFTMIRISDDPGSGIPMHLHETEDELFYILAGEFEFGVAGKTEIARAGDTVFGPRGIAHYWKAVGSTTCEMLVVILPGGACSMFAELAALGTNGMPAMEDVFAACAKRKISFVK